MNLEKVVNHGEHGEKQGETTWWGNAGCDLLGGAQCIGNMLNFPVPPVFPVAEMRYSE